MQLVNLEKLSHDWDNMRLFDGSYSGFQRYDVCRYPVLKEMLEVLKGNFWVPEIVNLSRDKVNFDMLSEKHKNAFRINLLFQTLADSVQSRGLEEAFSRRISDPMLESVNVFWAQQEIIHSLSYSYIVQNMFTDASSFFDSIDEYPEIKRRFEKEVSIYNNIDSEDIAEVLLHILVLESVKFMLSFLVTYSINEEYDSAINGCSNIIKLINNDEDVHVSISAMLLKIGRKKPREFGDSCMPVSMWEKRAKEIFEVALENEMEWYDFLSQYLDDIPMLSRPLVEGFLKWRIDKTLRMCGWSAMFGDGENELVKWYREYSNINGQQAALQETDGLTYNVFTLRNDL